MALVVSVLAPVQFASAAGPDFSRKWSPSGTALPRTASVHGSDVAAAAPAKPAHPVPPTWQPPAAGAARPHGTADLVLGAAPAAGARAAKASGSAPAPSDREAGAASATGLAVALAPLAADAGQRSAGSGQHVQVTVADERAVARAGAPGLLLSLARTDGTPAGPVRVAVDTAKLGHGTGGDWAARSHLVQLPACALTTPELAGCLERTPLPSAFDPATGTLSADVTLAGAAQPGGAKAPATANSAQRAESAAAAAAPMVLAAVADASGGAGTFAATGLNPSQSWTAGGSAGSFTYSYPITVPPTIGGAAPQVALSYDSSSVDGLTSSTNAQASWVGDGWSYDPGYVERSYQSCNNDGIANSGDDCWAGANLTLSLAGHSGELVQDDASCRANAPRTSEQSDCTWRLKDDDGTKVQFLTGADNGTWNGAYLKVTDTSGTAYYLGLNHLPDANGNPTSTGPASNSAWTVPVFSPKSGDPCYDSAKGAKSWCNAGWRWNLDYVVDPHGNLTSYAYTPETNYYALGGGQNNGTGTNTAYTRAGVLSTVGYGQRLADQTGANGGYQSAAQIVFDSGERCVTSTAACDPANRTSAHAGDWPDVPMDQQCGATGACTNYQPTFWSSKWLTGVTTRIRSNGGYQAVDGYVLDHRFVNVQNATENTQVPWLGAIRRTGRDATASPDPVELPPVSFTEMLLPNRVDGTNLVPSRPAFNRPRIQLITIETGGTIGVDYAPAACSRVNNVMPASADSDTKSCYNVKWHVPNEAPGAAPVDDWFQRYPVKTVTVNPNTEGSVPQTTAYTYGNAAWHRNDSPLVKSADRTWDRFRGYASVTAVTGNGNDGPKSQTSTTFHQGMDGDYKADGTTRSVQAAGPMSGPVTDSDWLSGRTLESDTYTAAGGSIAAYTVNTTSGPTSTATHARTGLPNLVARYPATTAGTVSKALKADGSWRTTGTTTSSDPAHANRVTTVLNTADGLPDSCLRDSYASGPDPQVSSVLSEQLTVSGPNACTASPTAANTVTWTRSLYDGKALGAMGATHDVTGAQAVEGIDAGGTATFTTSAVTVYDAYGRSTSVTDPNHTDGTHGSGVTFTTAYASAQPGELPTSMTVTTPAPAGAPDATGPGRVTTTALAPGRALPLQVTDPNGRVTGKKYDALGRLTAAWQPGRAAPQNASVTFAYAVPGVVNNVAQPPTVTTRTLRSDEGWTTSVSIMDGLARTVQVQSDPAVSAYHGRMLTDTFYDSQGRVQRANATWYNDEAAPGTTRYAAPPAKVPAQTVTSFDGRGRPVSSQLLAFGVAQSTTTTAYPGADRTDVSPPAGTTPTSSVTDALGNLAQLWQYRTATATGNRADADVTAYTTTPAGKPAIRTDAAGNVWTYGYDLRGRQTSATDPDSGTATQVYTPGGSLVSQTDGRGRTVAYTYDLLGRKTGSYAGSVATANQLTAYTYDTVVKGQPGASTRYTAGAGGPAYTDAVLSYDTAYHPTKTTTTVPGKDVGQADNTTFTYTYQARFDPITGVLAADNRSAIGDIPAETVNYSYDVYGTLSSFGSATTTYDLSSDWDAYGRSIRSTVNPWGTQIVLTNVYDESTGRPLSQFVDKQTAATGAVQQTTYAYDASGRVTGIRSIPDNTPSATDLQCFGYDYLGRLTSAWSDSGALNLAPNPAVGGRGACANSSPTSGATAPALTTVGGPAPYWQTYQYDLTGNRKQLVQHDPAGSTAKDRTVTQSFPAAGTVNGVNGAVAGPHAAVSASTVTGTGAPSVTSTEYDRAGGVTKVTGGADGPTGLTWDSEGRLSAYSSTRAGGVGYLYDAAGKQMEKTSPSGTTLYLKNDELTFSGGKLTGTRYYSIPGGITLVRQGGGSTYQFADPHGSNLLSIDGGSLAETRRPLDPFGNTRGAEPSSWAGDKGFVGGLQDSSTGLTTLGSRLYQPSTGRFVSPDPITRPTSPQQWNAYAYSENDPVNQSDPSGLAPCADGLKDHCGGGPTCSIFQPGCGATSSSGACSYNPYATNRCPGSPPATTTPGPLGSGDDIDQVDDAQNEGFGCDTPTGAQRTHLFVKRSSQDHGVIMVRFFIHQKEVGLGVNMLGDDRDFSDDPNAGYRMVLFWDTATGEISFTVAPSHKPAHRFLTTDVPVKMVPARPLDVGPYSFTDTTVAWHNNINPLETDPDNVKVDIHGVNSILPVFAANQTMTISLGTNSVSVRRKGDSFPDMEVVQYRRGMSPNVIAKDSMSDGWPDPAVRGTNPLESGDRDRTFQCHDC
ncbi:RHS repeat domain-containing protein [Kitasatospora sp. NPDC088391]|uniref:RHS repeat domain-containing protein n=1 Tax=Kitasatospora sp. NPDC088391 TaxID=3364074 RepID=UPI00381B0742